MPNMLAATLAWTEVNPWGLAQKGREEAEERIERGPGAGGRDRGADDPSIEQAHGCDHTHVGRRTWDPGRHGQLGQMGTR
jgi:hypothetical protein